MFLLIFLIQIHLDFNNYGFLDIMLICHWTLELQKKKNRKSVQLYWHSHFYILHMQICTIMLTFTHTISMIPLRLLQGKLTCFYHETNIQTTQTLRKSSQNLLRIVYYPWGIDPCKWVGFPSLPPHPQIVVNQSSLLLWGVLNHEPLITSPTASALWALLQSVPKEQEQKKTPTALFSALCHAFDRRLAGILDHCGFSVAVSYDSGARTPKISRKTNRNKGSRMDASAPCQPKLGKQRWTSRQHMPCEDIMGWVTQDGLITVPTFNIALE